MACQLKTAGYRVKQTEIWDLGVVVICIWGTFDVLNVLCCFGVIHCTGVKMASNSKTAG